MKERTSRSLLWRLLALLACLSLFAAACGGGDDDGGGATDTTAEGEEEGTPKPGGQITVGLEAETNNWLPGKFAGANGGEMVRNAIFDRLARRNGEGVVVPWLAESFESSADLKEWTVKLRSGVKFHDGTDLNSEAMKYNWDKLLTVQGSNTVGAITGTYKITALEVVDPLTFKYILAEPNAAFPDFMTGTAGIPFSPKAHQEKGESAGDSPVGTGPFKFVSWQRDSQLIVEKNPNYWRKGEPLLDRIIFRAIPDEDTRLQSLISGDIQVMQSLRQSIVKQANENDDIVSHNYQGNNGGGAIFNTEKPPVDDKRVRRGLIHAIDQNAMVEVLGGVDVAGVRNQYFNEDSEFYSKKAADAAIFDKHDVKKAKELLDQYIKDPARSDKKPVGSPIAVEFNCPPDPSLLELAQLYQKYWSDVGIQVSLKQVEQAAHIQNGLKGEFMINCWRQGGDSDPWTEFANAFGPKTNVLNFTNYTNPKIDENVKILQTEKDPAKRKAAVEAISLILAEDVPNLWTGGTPNVVATTKNLKGLDNWEYADGKKGQVQQNSVVLSWGGAYLDE